MSEFVAIIRDERGQGVRADRVCGWECAHDDRTDVHLTGGTRVFLNIPVSEFTRRLDRALTALAATDIEESA